MVGSNILAPNGLVGTRTGVVLLEPGGDCLSFVRMAIVGYHGVTENLLTDRADHRWRHAFVIDGGPPYVFRTVLLVVSGWSSNALVVSSHCELIPHRTQCVRHPSIALFAEVDECDGRWEPGDPLRSGGPLKGHLKCERPSSLCAVVDPELGAVHDVGCGSKRVVGHFRSLLVDPEVILRLRDGCLHSLV